MSYSILFSILMVGCCSQSVFEGINYTSPLSLLRNNSIALFESTQYSPCKNAVLR